ncbi:hypothetical protein TNCV_2936431 [Trichonephila clavipes]|nr:hypothetical protein TNCV_2936431 [Trichonephila clavipes]
MRCIPPTSLYIHIGWRYIAVIILPQLHVSTSDLGNPSIVTAFGLQKLRYYFQFLKAENDTAPWNVRLRLQALFCRLGKYGIETHHVELLRAEFLQTVRRSLGA